jgi:hypothetical protein
MKKLSSSQESLLDEISSKWITATMENKPFNKPVIETFIDILYWAYDFREPEIHYVQSPLASQQTAFELKLSKPNWRNLSNSIFKDMEQRILSLPEIQRKIGYLIWGKAKMSSLAKIHIEMQLRNFLMPVFEEFGQDFRNAQWCSFYDFCCEAGYIKRRRGIIDTYCEYILTSGVFFMIFEESHVIVCPNPSEINFNERGQLHSEEKAAVLWNDGFGLHFCNAEPVPEKSFTLSSSDHHNFLLPFREKISKIRQELLWKLRVDVFQNGVKARTIDKWHDKWGAYELIAVDIPQMNTELNYLKMLNPSTGKWHIESVPAVRSCKEALAWRDGETEYVVPSELT